MLRSLDLSDHTAQQIWIGAAEERGGLSSVGTEILDGILSGTIGEDGFPSDVLARLVEAGKLDLIENESLRRVLDRLPPPVRARVFKRTASAWVELFRRWASGDGPQPSRPDAETARAIVSGHSARDVVPVTATLTSVIWLFDTLPGYRERDFERVLRAFFPANREPDPSSAKALGRFVLTRRWTSAAYVIGEHKGYYPAYRAAYREVESLFGWLEKTMDWVFSGGRTDSLDGDGWWKAFHELCERLYPEGVQQRAVVEESGGDVAEMRLRDATGRVQWKHVIRGLRQGAFTFSAGDLLRTILSQHPKNKEARTMLDLYIKYID